MIVASISDNTNYTYTFTDDKKGNPQSVSLINDGKADVTLTIGSIAVTIKPGESFQDSFAPFTSAAIAATDSFRALIKR